MLHSAVSSSILLVTAFAPLVTAGRCNHPIVRKEWCVHSINRQLNLASRIEVDLLTWLIRRTLSNNQKADYIAAVKCLQGKPGRTQHLYPGVRSRYDDYLGTHINITDLYHFSVSFGTTSLVQVTGRVFLLTPMSPKFRDLSTPGTD